MQFLWGSLYGARGILFLPVLHQASQNSPRKYSTLFLKNYIESGLGVDRKGTDTHTSGTYEYILFYLIIIYFIFYFVQNLPSFKISSDSANSWSKLMKYHINHNKNIWRYISYKSFDNNKKLQWVFWVGLEQKILFTTQKKRKPEITFGSQI